MSDEKTLIPFEIAERLSDQAIDARLNADLEAEGFPPMSDPNPQSITQNHKPQDCQCNLCT
jgi:hypothetical protein